MGGLFIREDVFWGVQCTSPSEDLFSAQDPQHNVSKDSFVSAANLLGIPCWLSHDVDPIGSGFAVAHRRHLKLQIMVRAARV
jgi:hypothetical protein